MGGSLKVRPTSWVIESIRPIPPYKPKKRAKKESVADACLEAMKTEFVDYNKQKRESLVAEIIFRKEKLALLEE